jgi:hypothetical protein
MKNQNDPSTFCPRLETIASIQLWQAVVLQAVREARGPDSREKSDAHEWLIGGSKDFAEVCDLAGFNPRKVREDYKALLTRKQTKIGRRT